MEKKKKLRNNMTKKKTWLTKFEFLVYAFTQKML